VKGNITAKRCFVVKTKENDVPFVKWIFSAPSHPEVQKMFDVFMTTKALEAFGVRVEYDHAPASKQAQQLEKAVRNMS